MSNKSVEEIIKEYFNFLITEYEFNISDIFYGRGTVIAYKRDYEEISIIYEIIGDRTFDEQYVTLFDLSLQNEFNFSDFSKKSIHL